MKMRVRVILTVAAVLAPLASHPVMHLEAGEVVKS
jgi:hypothetical protein